MTGMPPLITSTVDINSPKYNSNRKKAIEEELFHTFDLALTVNLFGSFPKFNQFI